MTKTTEEHKKKINRERVRQWRQKNLQRNAEIQARYLIKKAVKLLQQAQREGASE